MTEKSASTETPPDPQILFVDDNKEIRRIMKTYLETQSLAVITAANGLDALRIFENNDAIGVIVTDQNMPFTTGRDLIREVRRINPMAKIILASANIPDGAESDARSEALSLRKPYSPDKLANAVWQLMQVSTSQQQRRIALNRNGIHFGTSR